MRALIDRVEFEALFISKRFISLFPPSCASVTALSAKVANLSTTVVHLETDGRREVESKLAKADAEVNSIATEFERCKGSLALIQTQCNEAAASAAGEAAKFGTSLAESRSEATSAAKALEVCERQGKSAATSLESLRFELEEAAETLSSQSIRLEYVQSQLASDRLSLSRAEEDAHQLGASLNLTRSEKEKQLKASAALESQLRAEIKELRSRHATTKEILETSEVEGRVLKKRLSELQSKSSENTECAELLRRALVRNEMLENAHFSDSAREDAVAKLAVQEALAPLNADLRSKVEELAFLRKQLAAAGAASSHGETILGSQGETIAALKAELAKITAVSSAWQANATAAFERLHACRNSSSSSSEVASLMFLLNETKLRFEESLMAADTELAACTHALRVSFNAETSSTVESVEEEVASLQRYLHSNSHAVASDLDFDQGSLGDSKFQMRLPKKMGLLGKLGAALASSGEKIGINRRTAALSSEEEQIEGKTAPDQEIIDDEGPEETVDVSVTTTECEDAVTSALNSANESAEMVSIQLQLRNATSHMPVKDDASESCIVLKAAFVAIEKNFADVASNCSAQIALLRENQSEKEGSEASHRCSCKALTAAVEKTQSELINCSAKLGTLAAKLNETEMKYKAANGKVGKLRMDLASKKNCDKSSPALGSGEAYVIALRADLAAVKTIADDVATAQAAEIAKITAALKVATEQAEDLAASETSLKEKYAAANGKIGKLRMDLATKQSC